MSVSMVMRYTIPGEEIALNYSPAPIVRVRHRLFRYEVVEAPPVVPRAA